MPTKPTMDVYYSQGSSEYQKQMAQYLYESGEDVNARFIDPIRGNVLYSDYLKAPQTYLTEKFNAGTGSYGGTEGFTEKPIPTTSTAPTMTTTQFAQAYQQKYGTAPSNQQLLDFTAQRATGTALPNIVQNLKPVGAITPDSLTQTKSTDLNGTVDLTKTGTTGDSSANIASGSLAAEIKARQDALKSVETPEQTQAGSLNAELQKLIPDLAGKASYEAEQKKKEMGTLNEQLGSVNAQIDALNAEKEKYRIDQEGKPITLSRITGSIAQNNAKLNAEILTLTAQGNALIGKIKLAEQNVTDAVNAKYAPIEESIAIKQAQLEALLPTLTKQETVQAAALTAYFDAQKQKIADAKTKEADEKKIIINYIEKYPDAKISFTDSVADAQLKIAGSKIYQDQVKSLGGNVNTTSSGTPWTSSTITPPTSQPPKQTFEQFLTQEENKAGQSFSQAKRDELKKQFEASQVAPTVNAQNADLSGYDFAVQQVIKGIITPDALLTGGTAGERSRYSTQLQDAQEKGLLKPAPSEKQKTTFNTLVNQYNKSPLIAASDRTIVLKNTINQIKANPSNGTLQLNLVYSYIQALDTYQSAVREGELGLVNSIDSKVGQLQGYVQKIQNGQIVRPKVAKQIADAAQNLVDTISQGASAKEKAFAAQAKVNGIQDLWSDFQGGFTSSFEEQNQSVGGIQGATSGNNTYTITQK